VKAVAAAALVAVGAVAVGACGGGDEENGTAEPPTTAAGEPLTAAERKLVGDWEETIIAYCNRAAVAVTGTAEPPTAKQRQRAFDAVDDLVALAEEKPGARVARGVDVELFLADLAENLQGANCDPAVIGRIDAGLASLP
jgi:hypothetical protein